MVTFVGVDGADTAAACLRVLILDMTEYISYRSNSTAIYSTVACLFRPLGLSGIVDLNWVEPLRGREFLRRQSKGS